MKTLLIALFWRFIFAIVVIYLLYRLVPLVWESFKNEKSDDKSVPDSDFHLLQKKNYEVGGGPVKVERKSRFFEASRKYREERDKKIIGLGSSHPDVFGLDQIINFFQECQWGSGEKYQEVKDFCQKEMNGINLSMFHKIILKLVENETLEKSLVKSFDEIKEEIVTLLFWEFLKSSDQDFLQILGLEKKVDSSDFLMIKWLLINKILGKASHEVIRDALKGEGKKNYYQIQNKKLLEIAQNKKESWSSIKEKRGDLFNLDLIDDFKNLLSDQSEKQDNIKRDKELVKAYQVLSLDGDASMEQLKKAFNREVKKFHPDMKENQGYEAFLTIKKAYDLIRDYLKKRKKENEIFSIKWDSEKKESY